MGLVLIIVNEFDLICYSSIPVAVVAAKVNFWSTGTLQRRFVSPQFFIIWICEEVRN